MNTGLAKSLIITDRPSAMTQLAELMRAPWRREVQDVLTITDEYTRECLAIIVARRLKFGDVLQGLADLFAIRGASDNVRGDNT